MLESEIYDWLKKEGIQYPAIPTLQFKRRGGCKFLPGSPEN